MTRALSGTLTVKIAGAVLGLIVNLVIARVLGVHGYGIYAYVLSWIAVLAIPASYGFPQWLVREVAIRTFRDNSSIRHLVQRATLRVASASAAVVVLSVLVIYLLPIKTSDYHEAMLTGLLLLPISTLTDVMTSVLHGLNRVQLSLLPRLLLHPALLLILLLFFLNTPLSPTSTLALNAASFFIVLLIAAIMLNSTLSKTPSPSTPSYENSSVRRGPKLFLLLTFVYLINDRADILMLGTLESPESAGAYAAANRLAGIVSYTLFSANAIIAPIISRSWEERKLHTIRQALKISARMSTLGAAFVGFILFLFRNEFLQLFGTGFSPASTAMSILIAAQLLNAAFGSVALFLNMTGKENVTFVGVFVAALINISLNALLIPKLHLVGAAIATAVSLSVWNILLYFWIFQNFHIDTSILGLMFDDTKNS